MNRARNIRLTLAAIVAVGVPIYSLATAPAPGPAAGSITPLDTAAVSGVESSIAIGSDGLGIISYHVGGNVSLLRVAHCLSVACNAVTITDIDIVGDVGWFSSIKIGSDGLALISYMSYRNANFQFTEDLKVAHCLNVACTAATVTTLDAASRVHGQTSLTIGGDGLGLIAYEDTPAVSGSLTKVNVAHCLNVACTAATLTTIDTVHPDNGELGGLGMASIATGSNGFGIVAYYDGGANNDLKVTVCGQADCSPCVHVGPAPSNPMPLCDPTLLPLNTTTTVDHSAAGALTGGWSSITVGRDGLALISYESNFTSTGSDLKVAHCVNVLCTAVTTTIADTGGFTGWYTSIAIGGDGLGVVAYYDAITGDLKVVHCSNLVCGTASNTTVDAIDNVGRNPSITIGRDGLPLISYLHLTRDDLRVAHCADAACTGPFVTPF
jgi:hypothetical protein